MAPSQKTRHHLCGSSTLKVRNSLELKIIGVELSVLSLWTLKKCGALPGSLHEAKPQKGCEHLIYTKFQMQSLSLFYLFIYFFPLLSIIFPALSAFHFAAWILLPGSESSFRNRVVWFYFHYASKMTLVPFATHNLHFIVIM